MYHTVYKSLDKTSSLFGLKGTYLGYAAAAVGGAAVVGFIVGGAVNGLVGVLVFLALAAVAYLAVMRFQAKYSERERTKWFCAHRLPDYITVRPQMLRRCVRLRLTRSDLKDRPQVIRTDLLPEIVPGKGDGR